MDISTLRMVLVSAPMNIAKYKYGGHIIIKFDFPHINLLDSSHHGLCDGAVIFNINSVPGLPIGATVFNHAGIFFDDNAVVMTDTVEDLVGVPLSATSPSPLQRGNSSMDVFPNPAADVLTIKTDGSSYSGYTITNTLGVVVLQQSITGAVTTVDIKALPVGMYFVSFTPNLNSNPSNVGIRVMRKFVKE